MIKIDLKLFVTLSKFLPGEGESFQVDEGTSIGGLIENLSIPSAQVKLIFVNGKKVASDYRLQQGDRVGLFPPVGGG
ncbi:MAG: MoaD/ThiS family protein [Desulfobacteraceae bacterium]|nr:MoaD/ThiS family protein [Desulfobacteraceae bacterium]